MFRPTANIACGCAHRVVRCAKVPARCDRWAHGGGAPEVIADVIVERGPRWWSWRRWLVMYICWWMGIRSSGTTGLMQAIKGRRSRVLRENFRGCARGCCRCGPTRISSRRGAGAVIDDQTLCGDAEGALSRVDWASVSGGVHRRAGRVCRADRGRVSGSVEHRPGAAPRVSPARGVDEL